MGSKAMTIKFSVNHNDGYVLATWTKQVTDKELFGAYVDFYQGDEWNPTFNELSDMSQADTTDITSVGLQSLAYFSERMQKQYKLFSWKVAIFAPNPLPFGLARMYAGMTDKLPRRFHIFTNLQDAKDWLKI
jgi:hypothetical protein